MMAVKREAEQPSKAENQGHTALDVLVGENVLRTLGRPPGMQRLQVRCLWATYYRVNVFVGEDIASARITNSYFVQAKPDGTVLQAEPPITRQYGA
jgi:hypothetical protein